MTIDLSCDVHNPTILNIKTYYVFDTHIMDRIRKLGYNKNNEIISPFFSMMVEFLLRKAVERARKNRRKTVFAHDF